MKTFYRILVNSLVAGVTNNFLWFAITFWAYLETRSVLATSIIAGSYMLISAFLGLYFGTVVDHQKKKTAMLVSSLVSLGAFIAATVVYIVVPEGELLQLGSLQFWGFVSLVLLGAIVGNLRLIALSTTVTMLVPEGRRDRANGLVGAANGVSFAITSVFSGLVVGQLGMAWALWLSVGLTLLVTLDLLTIKLKEEKPVHHGKQPPVVDVRGAMAAINKVPGLLALIFFTTLNNFLAGVFMSLLDPYGLSLVSVEAWGILWGVVSIAFIIGGLIVAKKGLGKNPLKSLLLANVAIWVVSILFPVRSSIIMLVVGMTIYMLLLPVIEAAEQTIIQKVVPFKKQGRVFGFAQTVENAAAPITAFLIGPIAQLVFIPFMTTGNGPEVIGAWFGAGPERGMALIFIIAGVIGLIVTLLALRSRPYHMLSDRYQNGEHHRVPLSTTPRG